MSVTRRARLRKAGLLLGAGLSEPLFLDATGDGVLAYRAGAEFRWGRESKAQ